ncbi:MAG: hypothetical protein REI96_22495 [Flavobacterium nitrogenifigens]|uniref:hypothetical protein n=1 Tax=Flavobacterium nitrogenifigens TaxID=1617283 RepID=UPI0028075EBA|nr:hypothetical protein [Flavobacterium nitrogenifigens]MDQ8015233.1 hypothetical protein [Flavobacterium nitrogenifigens]
MNEKIAIIILGYRNSGKSNTFYELFKRKVYSGHKYLSINQDELEVFVKNTSFEETGEKICDEIFIKNTSFEETGRSAVEFFEKNVLPNVILCAVQYKEEGKNTIEYFRKNDYYLYIQWLNPGYNQNEYEDYLGFEDQFSKYGEFYRVSGEEKENRANILKNFLLSKLSKRAS